jgi:type IV pilus assembly protein PilQ
MKDSSLVSIELRESVPYFAEQTDDLLVLHFEASSIPPKSLDEAKLPSWKKAILQPAAEIKALEPEPLEVGMPVERVPEEGVPSERMYEEGVPEAEEVKYTGEKIALNFYDTDIKNVFRILMNVSNKNFAIDKDVKGKVTLTLDKPVPWDQVLDLVLKMNRLEMVYEGDIVRIATIKTLKAERAYQQAKFASKKKIIEQEKALEPLVTEYIPISYADASGDILPHLVLTEGRGSVTVDGRNNQIIITDVAEKVELAKQTISRIDKVTPQVIIEARIVEATDTFSRDIGSLWGTTSGPRYNSQLDGNISWDMSASNPAPAVANIGVQFTSLGSSAFELLDLRLQASESDGQIKIISAPRVLTLDNTAASIKQGLSYPFNKLDADGNTTTEFKDIALQLDVTPHVTPDDRVAMEITVKNNEIGAIINNQISFTTKEATTELLVDDGDTIVIAGIRKTRKDTGEAGVPGLRRLPIIGWLFKSKYKTDIMEELLIFITPRIVKLEQRVGELG